MEPTPPPLLETYEDARLLWEGKGWGLNKVAAELAQLADLARFHLNPTKLSQISRAGANRRIEPEVAAAIEGLPTWPSYERQTEVVTKGLLALHGDPPSEEVERLAAELRERLAASEHALKLVEALEEKAGQRLTSLGQKLAEKSASELAPNLVEAVEALGEKTGQRAAERVASELSPKLVEVVETLAPKVVEAVESLTPKMVEAIDEKASQRAVRFSQQIAEGFRRASRKQVAISAGSVALVGGLVLLLGAQLLPRRADAAQPGPCMLVLPGAGPDGSTVSVDPRSLIDNMPAAWGEKPLDQPIPIKTIPGQKVAPCDAGLAEVVLNGNCWLRTDLKPPCGRLFRHEDSCYRPIAADPKKPVEPAP